METEKATRHTTSCKRVWMRYDLTCPRCKELDAGMPARIGWGGRRLRDEQVHLQEIAAHFAPGGPHQRGVCGPVCTAFDS